MATDMIPYCDDNMPVTHIIQSGKWSSFLEWPAQSPSGFYSNRELVDRNIQDLACSNSNQLIRNIREVWDNIQISVKKTGGDNCHVIVNEGYRNID